MGWIAAVLSGITAGLSYPAVFGGVRFPDLGGLAFVAWIPLFYVLRGASPKRAFLFSFITGMVQYGFSMYWLYTAMNTFGNLSPFISVVVLLVLVLILSAYLGLIFLLSQWVCLRHRWPTIWVRPFFWVGIEFLRGHLPMGGFPWSQLGYSQGHFPAFIQVADVFGVYGVTFLIVFFNELISLLLRVFSGVENLRWKTPLLTAAILLVADLGYGTYRLHDSKVIPTQTVQVGIVQGNIPQDEKWQMEFAEKIAETYRTGTLQLEAKGATFILWPEAAFPLILNYDLPTISFPFGVSKADLLFGAITKSHRSLPTFGGDVPYYNSALLLDAQGKVLDFYHKRHLVPFGEYVPWKDILFFAKKLTVEVGNLQPGKSYRPMNFRGKGLGILICYEDIFPEIARIMVADGAQALINITNDAWYGYSSAAFQHQVFSQFRSVETRRALVRATNTGLSSMIDRWGRVVWQGEMFQRQDFMTNLPFYQDRSIYVRIGDVFPILSLFFCGVIVVMAKVRRKD